MCGIAGFVTTGFRGDSRDVVHRMVTALRHRGPDDQGEYVDAQAALGSCRLSIIDLAGGRQPIGNENGTVHAVLNGEIYNFRELRSRLQRRGHQFRTQSDTEVVVHAYEQDGEDFVTDLDGMFALALWDGPGRKLLLARDRMGEKPLYYYDGPGVFVFGSELRALVEHPDVPRALDLQSLSRYLLVDAVPAPHSILAGAAKLAPAHTLVVSPGAKPQVTPYWSLSFAPDHSIDEREWRGRLIDQLEVSVRSRLVGDVPVGVFVSGGIDSGSVATFAARHANALRLQTFAVGFDTPSYDERSFARVVAARFGAEHHEIVFTATEALSLMERVGSLLDEPLVDASFLPKYALARAARGSVKVALSGDGGDEIFCGYPTFLADAAARWLLATLPPTARRVVGRLIDGLPASPKYASVDFLLKQFMRALPYPAPVRTQLLLGGITAAEQSRLLSPGVRHALEGFDPYAELTTAIEQLELRDPIERLIHHHARFYLADQTLVAMDRASMAAGLEVRAPFLDPALVELAATIPSELKLNGWTTKYILKSALEGILPPTVIRRRKQGLGVPIAAWLRGPLRGVMESRLAPARVRHRGLFDPTAVTRLVSAHVEGRGDHRKILWALLMLDAWCDHYLPHERWT
ncbi:MAG: asparagine synthase (glutamine-hydrolyzing) [Candidatus Rokuibacteriota bacterium]|nr:MAG: asparagine synthase (glutamine-hydrolyzing) [Candidatus Rokubacteria bacterium]